MPTGEWILEQSRHRSIMNQAWQLIIRLTWSYSRGTHHRRNISRSKSYNTAQCSQLEPTNTQPTGGLGPANKSSSSALGQSSSALGQCGILPKGLPLQASAVAKAVLPVELSSAILGCCSAAILGCCSWAIWGRRARLYGCRLMAMVHHTWHLVAVPALPAPATLEAAAWRHRKCIARQCLQWHLRPFWGTVLPASCPWYGTVCACRPGEVWPSQLGSAQSLVLIYPEPFFQWAVQATPPRSYRHLPLQRGGLQRRKQHETKQIQNRHCKLPKSKIYIPRVATVMNKVDWTNLVDWSIQGLIWCSMLFKELKHKIEQVQLTPKEI